MDHQHSSTSESSRNNGPKREETSEAQSNAPGQGNVVDEKPKEAKKPSKVKQLWTKSGLDIPTLKMMVKGSLPPTIAIAMYQSDAIAAHYSTLGYLVAITSVLGFCIMPRGKFIQTMSMNLLAVCFGAAFALLALWTSIQARIHTTPPGVKSAYNSSQSAVCGIWLFFFIYCINVVRAARPQFQFPAIIVSIFIIVSMTYGPLFPNMSAVIGFMKQLIEAFLTGFALATGVSLTVFPMSCRTIVFKEMTGYVMGLRGVFKAHAAYMASLEAEELLATDEAKNVKAYGEEINGTKERKMLTKEKKKDGKPKNPLSTPAAGVLKATQGNVIALHIKLQADLIPAKQEFAWGKLGAGELSELFKLLRSILIPANGLCSLTDILERLCDEDFEGMEDEKVKDIRQHQTADLHFVMKTLHTSFSEMTGAMDEALQHVLLTLQLIQPPKKKAEDEEAKGDKILPGDEGFAAAYKKKVNEFYTSKQVTLETWCEQKGLKLPPDFFDDAFVRPESWFHHHETFHDRRQRQLFLVLFLEYMLWRAGKAVLDFVQHVDKQKKNGKLDKSHIIFPGQKRLRKWFTSMFRKEDMSADEHFLNDMEAGGGDTMYLGDAFGKKKDPEHLPPENLGQRIGEKIRLVPKFFRSNSSAFGFRVACATMSIAIVDYLAATQSFFRSQRLLWSMIMVAISMTRTAGQSTYNFMLRVFGTFVAMCGAYIVWYIVDGHTGGVIVFLWLSITCGFYVVLKLPKLIIVGILGIVTTVLVIGYELQVQKLGVKASESNGQPAYPPYLLAPYRLACVAGGLLVAFIWTIFPFPISETTELRKDMGGGLYMVANLYSIVHETVQARIRGDNPLGDEEEKDTPAYQLVKARHKVFSKAMGLITTMRTNSEFSRFQLRVGGKFPAETYEQLIEKLQNVLNYTILIWYASETFDADRNDDTHPSKWSSDFRRLVNSVDSTSHEITSLLSLLSSSMSNGQPLPPYLKMPEDFRFVKKLEELDHDILSVRHIAEPEYSAFAVVQISAQCLRSDLGKLTKLVKALVGEMDFSFHVVRTGQNSSESSLDTDSGKGKVD